MAQVVGNTNEIAAVYATSNSGDGVYAHSNSGAGVRAFSKSDRGVLAHSDGFAVEAASTNLTGVVGITQSSSTDQSGVYGGNGGAGPGVRGETEGGNSSPAVYGSALRSGTIGAGVWGDGGEGYGVVGKSTEGYGVVGVGSYAGIQGTCNRDENPGVYGLHSGSSGDGVLGQGTGNHAGVYGRNLDSTTGEGVRAYSSKGVALRADTGSPFSPIGRAGLFFGGVEIGGGLLVTGKIEKQGGGFRVDHPRDPANKYLNHSFVESSDMKNVYDGVAQLGEDGTAWVDLPEWFEALNGDFRNGEFRYQLTPVGGAAPNLHVAEEIYENRFKIAGGEGGMKVCWQVTGTRKDRWAAANPCEVEQDKPQEERGRYLEPSLYGAPEEQSVMRARTGEDSPQRMSEEPPSFDERPQPPARPPGAPPMPPSYYEPPRPPVIPPGVAAPGHDFVRMEEEHRQQIDELRGQIEELRRGRLEEEIDELRRQIKKLRRRRKR